MIVIVIMGILVAVAIPVYGAVTKNAETKTCKSNMSNIKSMASTWQMTGGADGGMVAIGSTATDISNDQSFKNQFEGGVLPKCPVAKDNNGGDYTVSMVKDGTGTINVTVTCPMWTADGDYSTHVAD